jgi:L-fuconolactonase
MFGGDWPVVRLAADYARWVEVAETAVSDLTEAQRDKVFYTNACDFYHLA